VSEVEGAAEVVVEGGVQGDREREAAVEGARALRRSEVQSGATGLPHDNRRGKNSAASGRGSRCRERCVGRGATGAPGAGRGAQGGGGGAGCWGRASVPTHPTLHGIGGGGVGDGRGFLLSFLCLFPWCAITFREGRAAGTRGTCNEPPRADCGRENRAKCTPP